MKKKIQVELNMGNDFVTRSTIRGHACVIDQSRDAGGTDQGPSPLEYLLFSLGGCYAAIGRIIARQRRLPVHAIRVRVSGAIDTDGLLGKPTDGRVGFEGFHVEVAIDADMTDAEKRALIEEIEHRCPVSENLSAATPVEVALGAIASDAH